MKTLILAITTLIALGLGTTLTAQDAADAAAKQQPTWTSVPAALDTCIVSGRALKAEKTVTFEAGGRTFQTCCKRCKGKVEKDPAAFVEKLDAAIVAAQAAHYPLDKCPVSGKANSAKSKDVVANDILVRVCCGKCAKKVAADPAKYAQKVQTAARDQQAKSYPLATCVVSGDEVDAKDAVEVMYGTTLVRLCCEDCIDGFKKSPTKYLTALHDAAAKAEKKADKGGDGADGANTSCCSSAASTSGGSCCSSKAKPAEKAAAGGCCSEKSAPKAEKAKIQ